MPRDLQTVAVYADLEFFDEPLLMGWLRCQASRAGDIFSFEYDRAWLQHPEALTFDPDLAMVQGAQYPATGRANFGIFLDSSPDRWGRVLMQKRENMRARLAERRARSLTEWDFLLGVHDETRLGALRFRDVNTGQFIDSDDEFAAPPIASLRELQAASYDFEMHPDEQDPVESERWRTQLFAPGSSLGGARPKASVRDEEGCSAWRSFPAAKTGVTSALGNLWLTGLRPTPGLTYPTPGRYAYPRAPTPPFLRGGSIALRRIADWRLCRL
jgi:serine/threonine-protein kinase HipA